MKWWMIVLFILFILIVLGSMILVPHNLAHNLILQYIYTLASWPLIILVLGLVLLIKFKEPISFWIRKFRFKTPQGYEIGPKPQPETKPIEEGKIKEFKEKWEKEKTQAKGYIEFIHFERIIRWMYRSQYHLLKDLKKTGSSSLSFSFLYYYEYQSQGGDKKYTVADYMGWVEKFCGFIKTEQENDKWLIKLTERGNFFIRYCDFMNYSENIFMPL